jgi:hypothetical protein
VVEFCKFSAATLPPTKFDGKKKWAAMNGRKRAQGTHHDKAATEPREAFGVRGACSRFQ